MKIACFAKHEVGLASVRALAGAGADLGLVVVMASQAETAWYGGLESLCAERGIAFLPVRHVRDEASVEAIASSGPDLAFSVFFTQIVPAAVLALPLHGIVNFHPSLLPRYRGPHPVNWAIIRGEEETGLTAHYMVEEVDAGDIIRQWRVPIGPDDDLGTVAARIHRLVPGAVLEVLELFRTGSVRAVAQDESQASYFPRRTEKDDIVEWSATSREIHNLVRGLAEPLPGALCFQEGRRVVLRAACPVEEARGDDRPGTILSVDASGMLVRTGDGAVLVTRLDVGGQRSVTPLEAARAGLLGRRPLGRA